MWELSADEKRLLVITTVGGLASILLGAAIIGAALALVRVEHGNGSGLVTGTVGLVLLLVAALWYSGKWQGKVRLKWSSVTRWVLPGFYALLVCVVILWWIGLAAGVK